MPDEFAKLKVDSNGVPKVTGDGRIDCVMTIKIVDSLLSQPPATVFTIINLFTPRTKRSFDSIVKLDKELTAKFAAIQPKREVKREDVVEELVLGLDPIAVIIFTVSGERFVAKDTRNYDNLLTFDEFEAKFGRSVLEWVRHDANVMIETFQRAVALLENDPTEYTLDVVTKDMAADTKKIVVYAEEQIHLFAKRQSVSIMNSSSKKD